MKKLASACLTEEQFWDIIENSNKGHELEKELSKLSEDEIFGYWYWWSYFNNKSYNQELWAVAYTVLGGCSDDGFDYFRFWLLSRGKSVYFEALRDADTLCDEFDKLADDEYPEWEDIDYVPKQVFEKKFKKDFYEAEDNYDFDLIRPQIELEWDEDDEESIRDICPKTFDKWWDNDRF
jgi:hypothetical protein